VRLANCIFN